MGSAIAGLILGVGFELLASALKAVVFQSPSRFRHTKLWIVLMPLISLVPLIIGVFLSVPALFGAMLGILAVKAAYFLRILRILRKGGEDKDEY